MKQTHKQAHTPGPLQATKAPMSRAGKYAENDHLIHTLDNLHVAEVFQYQGVGHAHAPAEANAHRLVGCWNACEGIPTEALEAGVVAEMLAVLESLTDPEGHIWHGGNDECTGECREVRAAIAQAKGE